MPQLQNRLMRQLEMDFQRHEMGNSMPQMAGSVCALLPILHECPFVCVYTSFAHGVDALTNQVSPTQSPIAENVVLHLGKPTKFCFMSIHMKK